MSEKSAWLVRSFIPGRLLLDVIQAGSAYDPAHVVSSVLKSLCELEAVGLYHADLRTWNVVLSDDGDVRIIDYGHVGPKSEDIEWPHDVFLSFWTFVREVTTGQVDPLVPVRTPSFSPLRLPEPFRSWAVAAWMTPSAMTFKALLALWEARGAGPDALPQSAPFLSWMDAIESYLAMIQIENLQGRAASARQSAHAANALAESLKQQAAELDRQLDIHSQKLLESARNEANLTRELQVKASDLEAARADKARAAEQHRLETDHLKRQLDEARSSLADILASRCWRMTGPLRAVLNAAYRRRGG